MRLAPEMRPACDLTARPVERVTAGACRKRAGYSRACAVWGWAAAVAALPAFAASMVPSRRTTAVQARKSLPTSAGSARFSRRLNRVEYENSVRDLLGVEVDLKHLLPVESAPGGFDTNGEALHVSSFLMERYLEAADTALEAAIAHGPRPEPNTKRYSYKDEFQINHEQNVRLFRKLDDGVVFFSSTYSPTVLSRFYPPLGGKYRFRISTYGFQSAGKPVTFRVECGNMLMAGRRHLVGYFDAPPDKPTVTEFVDRLDPRDTIQIVPYGTGTEHDVFRVGAESYRGAGLAVQWVEVEGPLNDVWPPASHRRLFGDLPLQPAAGGGLEVVSKEPAADAERILRAFVRRAYRRPMTDADVRPFIGLVQAKLAAGSSFERAVRAGLTAVMVSPGFLFLAENPGKLDDGALASRLSYFLWSTMPDEALLGLAGQGKLGEPAVLRGQVERMLQDQKAAAFTENFVGQWLGLRDIDSTTPDSRLYPEFDDLLRVSMAREPTLFFDELLKHDLSVTELVASDWTMLNGRLAKQYGIPGVEGYAFRKAPLPPQSHRGGVLTMAAVLKVTANGTNTSPVVRGAWVLRNLLGTPPAPPPAGVPALEPDIRGATTIREQLAKHRNTPACASCHTKIDPPGWALESFDVIGGWRENYRSVGNGEEVTVDGRRMPYLKGAKVDAADVLSDGRRFAGIDELKRLLLHDKDQIARALTEKLLAYGTGRALDAADRREVETIVGRVRSKGYGLRTLVQEIVQSKAFRYR